MATVIIPQALQEFAAGRDRIVVPGRTLRQVFDRLDVEYPGLKAQLVVDDAIRPGLAVAVNDEMTSRGLLEPVPEDGVVRILPALGGG